jgi:predicted transcriptional regulator YdeE
MGVSYSIDKSIEIDESIEKVFSAVGDFATWSIWSPWLCQEPECPVSRTGDPCNIGHRQEWKGKRIGTGSIEIIAINRNQQIDYDLKFIDPWESSAKVSFKFNEMTKDKTKVSWTMDSELPWFMFFFKKMMVGLIGSDYMRGLSMLKDYCENGEVHSHTEIKGVTSIDSFYYAGIYRKSTIDKMPQLMGADFQALQKAVEEGKLPKPEGAVSFNYKHDFATGVCEFTSALRYKEQPEAANGFEVGQIQAHSALQVEHTGSYKHLGNAWSTAINEQRNQKMKINKKAPMWEIYLNMPGEVAEKDLKTQIHIPVK